MDFELVDVPIGLLDTSMDPAVLPPGALSLAENCGCDTNGVYTKRNGYTALPVGPAAITRLLGRKSELLAVGSGRLWSYGISPNMVAPNPTISFEVPPTQTAQQFVYLNDTKDITKATRATTNGITVHAWIQTDGIYAQIQTSTGLYNAGLVESSTFLKSLHSAVVGTKVIVVYGTTTPAIRYFVVDTAALTVGAPAAFPGLGTLAANAPFDLSPLSSTEVCVAWAETTPRIIAARFTVASGTVAASAVISTETATGAVSVVATPGEFGCCLYYSAGAGGMRACTFDPSTMAQTHAPFAVDGTVAAMGGQGIARLNSTQAIAAWGRASAGIVKAYSQSMIIRSNGTIDLVTSSVNGTRGPVYNTDVASKPYVIGGKAYVTLRALYTSQTTYFTVRLDLDLVGTSATTPWNFVEAVHAYRTAYTGALDLYQTMDVDFPSANVAAVDLPLDYKFLSAQTTRAVIASLSTDFAAATASLGCEVGGSTLLANGAVYQYDGQHTVEANFFLYPEITQATPGAVGAGGMDNGSYGYIAIFQSTDANGNTQRSTTSLIKSATTAAGAGLGKVTLVVDYLTMSRIIESAAVAGGGLVATSRKGLLSLYRSQANVAQTYYLVAQTAMLMEPSNVTIVDQAHDSTIAANPVLYTSGGVLDREPPPPAMQMIMHRNRVWGISSADRKLLFYSGEYGPGELPWFSTVQQFRIDTGGDITAIASMDDKLIVFKSDRIFKIYGSGGNPLGQNNDLSPAALITTDTGCSDPRSIVVTAGGLMFLSPKGIMLLSRKEELHYIGQPVQGYADEYSNVVAAHMLPAQRELRFEVSGPIAPLASPLGQKLVYNYRTGAWTTHRNYTDAAAIDAIVVGGVYYWATAAGTIYQENATFLDPASTYISTVIEFGFQAPAGKQGLIRCRYVMVNDEWRADHGLEVQVGLNYSPVYTMSKTWSRTVVNALPSEQVSMPLSQQKCESLRVRVSDFADGGTPGEGFRLRGLSMYAGVKKGSFRGRMPAAAKGA